MATFVETLLGSAEGNVVSIAPDHIVITDGLSSSAVEGVETVAFPEKVSVIFDHDVPTGSPDGANTLRKIRKFADTFGCPFYQAKGVGYQWMLNEKVKAGQIVVGGGNHAAIYGAIGALGLDVKTAELRRILEKGFYSVVIPKTIHVEVTGSLAGASILDAALSFLRDADTTVEGKFIEFSSNGLSQHEKAVLCMMATGTGAFGAAFTDTAIADLTLDLGKAVPMLRLPCQTRDGQKKAAIAEKRVLSGTGVQVGFLGGVTGGTIEELRKAVSLLRGKKLARGFRLCVAPATSEDYLKALDEGLITALIDFNAQILASGDHSVMWQGAGVLGKDERLITTGLYTYTGCTGVDSSLVYTGSVETVCQAATTKML